MTWAIEHEFPHRAAGPGDAADLADVARLRDRLGRLAAGDERAHP